MDTQAPAQSNRWRDEVIVQPAGAESRTGDATHTSSNDELARASLPTTLRYTDHTGESPLDDHATWDPGWIEDS